jgi:hypothetical protein
VVKCLGVVANVLASRHPYSHTCANITHQHTDNFDNTSWVLKETELKKSGADLFSRRLNSRRAVLKDSSERGTETELKKND